ncbi:MAG: hypothetical protein WC289_00580 [Patescibacteria group bacterium]
MSAESDLHTGPNSGVAPEIYEIFLFGSTADTNVRDVHDVDLMVIDNTYYSRHFEPPRGFESWYEHLSGNLAALLSRLGYQEQEGRKLCNFHVDLHVLPLSVLLDKDFRFAMGSRHKDPQFFKNCFSVIMRFDQASRSFVRVTIEELERKYNTDLTDLR